VEKVINVEAELAKDNKGNARATRTTLALIADALWTYAEAADNVRRHGSIVAHPRTAAPIDNPYLRVMQQAAKGIERGRGLKTDRVFLLVREHFAKKGDK
jgi:phage terminase small subunit